MLFSSGDVFWQEGYPIGLYPAWLFYGGIAVAVLLLATAIFLFFWFTKRSD